MEPTSITVQFAVDIAATLTAAENAGRTVGTKGARRANLITVITNEKPVTVTTFNDDRDHKFGTLLGSVRWSVNQSAYVVSLNDAITTTGFRIDLHAAFARGLKIKPAALAVDTMPLPEPLDKIEAPKPSAISEKTNLTEIGF